MHAPPPDLRSLGRAITGSDTFDVSVGEASLDAVRRRRIGNRGLLRFLFPRIVARVALDGGHVRVSLRPDAWAIVTLVVFGGAIATELTMDRALYPRDYPPAAPFVLGGIAFVAAVLEAVITRRGVVRSLGRAD